jgi:prephenate dehydrogenase
VGAASWRIGLIGCGHIGGSLALALRAAGRAARVIGWDVDPGAAARALELGLVDEVASGGVAGAAASADVVVLAVPVAAIGPVAAAAAGALAPDAVIMDVGSVKTEPVAAGEAAAAAAGRAGRFVGAHPMAGSERSGPDAAEVALFRGRVAIVTPTAATAPDALETVRALWRAAGAHVVEMAPDAHDRAVAAVSHLPHVIAFSLAALVNAEPGLAGLAGPSYASATRVAASPPGAWAALLTANRAALLPWLDRFGERLSALRAALAAGDEKAVRALLEARDGV